MNLRRELNFFFALFLILAGCVSGRPVSSFSTVPEGKTTAAASRFYVIDDFNSGIGRNKLGTEWKTVPANGDSVKLVTESEDGLNRWGGSLGVEFSAEKGMAVGISTPLEGLDASEAEAIVFLVRKNELETFRGDIKVKLADHTGKAQTAEARRITNDGSVVRKEGWVEMAVPVSKFKALDFDQLEAFELLLHPKEEIAGKLVFDEIAFFGAPDLVFVSARDNLLGFPAHAVALGRRQELLQTSDERRFLKEIAKDTWGYFENIVDRKTYLPMDHIRVGKSTGVGAYTSPTDAALYWMSLIAAADLDLISKADAAGALRRSFDTVKRLDRWGMHFWYNFYQTRSLKVTRKYVSTVDNAWLAAALVILRQAYPEEFESEASALLEPLDFADFFDPQNGQIKIGYDDAKGAFEPYHYGLLATEARLISYVAIGKKDLDETHWARLYRTLPPDWEWQRQGPEGYEDNLFGRPVFEGHYTYLNRKFVPSWGGSLFEFLAPLLVVDEQRYAPHSLAKNNIVVTELHIEHALSEKKYPVWGIAPCAVANGKGWAYREYGIPFMGAKGYADRGVVAPYASILALEMKPKEVIANLRELLSRYEDIYGEYGFYDSVQLDRGFVNQQYLILDEAMGFLAIANYLTDGALRKRFESDSVGKRVLKLLSRERFSI